MGAFGVNPISRTCLIGIRRRRSRHGFLRHGFPLIQASPLSAALTAGTRVGPLTIGHHVKREASHFIPSTLFNRTLQPARMLLA
jgi:hypothetical protein